MKFSPHEYQRYCISRILETPALGLFLDMGLGKTVVTLTAANELMYNRFEVSRVLIIAPKKVAEATWSEEAAKWEHLKHLRFSLILGSEQKRIRAIYAPADVYVINRENVVWLVDYLRNNWCFDMVVIDESSSFKSHRAKRFKSLTWIRPHVKRLIELTGTPAPNSLADLWAQLYLLDEGARLGRNITAFRESFFRANTHGGHFTTYEETEGAAAEIQQRISDICISMKSEDYLQLPELVYDVVPVKLDDKAQKAYDEMEREMLLQIDAEVIDAGSAAALSNKLLQLCNGAVYTGDADKWVELHNCKIEAFMELIERLNSQPALVFYNFKHDRERLVAALTNRDFRKILSFCRESDRDHGTNTLDDWTAFLEAEPSRIRQEAHETAREYNRSRDHIEHLYDDPARPVEAKRDDLKQMRQELRELKAGYGRKMKQLSKALKQVWALMEEVGKV